MGIDYYNPPGTAPHTPTLWINSQPHFNQIPPLLTDINTSNRTTHHKPHNQISHRHPRSTPTHLQLSLRGDHHDKIPHTTPRDRVARTNQHHHQRSPDLRNKESTFNIPKISLITRGTKPMFTTPTNQEQQNQTRMNHQSPRQSPRDPTQPHTHDLSSRTTTLIINYETSMNTEESEPGTHESPPVQNPESPLHPTPRATKPKPHNHVTITNSPPGPKPKSPPTVRTKPKPQESQQTQPTTPT